MFSLPDLLSHRKTHCIHVSIYCGQSKSVLRNSNSTKLITIQAAAKEPKQPWWQNVSATNCAVTDGNTGKLIFGKNATDRKEIASLTKIMTCYTVLQLAKKWNLNLKETFAEVSAFAASLEGTRAELHAGDILSVYDLLYAMMLPSGNDAAFCLAEFFGGLLYKAKISANSHTRDSYANLFTPCKCPSKYFVFEMNENAKMLGLIQTTYTNPHGLNNIHNRSTANDVGKLAAHCMKISCFKEIVGSKEYSCEGYRQCSKRTFCWKNTHMLLWKGFNGIKTGVTTNAGPCLCSSIEKNGRSLIIVLLNSRTLKSRWEETIQLSTLALGALDLENSEQRGKH